MIVPHAQTVDGINHDINVLKLDRTCQKRWEKHVITNNDSDYIYIYISLLL